MRYLIITLVLCSISLHAQNLQSVKTFYSDVYKADLLAKENRNTEAILAYEDAFTQIDYIHHSLLFKVLRLARKTNDKPRIKSYSKRLKRQKKCPPQNKPLLKTIDSLLKQDQIYMKSKYFKAKKYCIQCESDVLCDKTSKKYLSSKELSTIQAETFSSNIQHLLKLIEQHGYIGEEMLGTNHAYSFRVQIFHFDTDTNNVVLGPILEQALIEHKLTPLMYSLAIDRHLFQTTGRQIYWTSSFNTDNPNLSEQEIANVLKLREDIGIFGSDFNFSQDGNGKWRINNTYGSFY